MGKKAAAAVVGVTLVGVGTLALLSHVKAQVVASQLQVQVLSNPIPTILSIDGQHVETPNKITLASGMHTFAAIPTSPSIQVTWGFHKWTKNGVTISYNPTAQINITEPCIIKAEYTMIDAGWNSPASLSDVPL